MLIAIRDIVARLRQPLLLLCGALCSLSSPALGGESIDFLNDDFYEEESAYTDAYDPIEPFNRMVFAFNDFTFTWVIEPVASGYATIVPGDIRGTIWNFFNNLEEPVRAANCILQGRMGDAGSALGRFLLNTIFGVFGLADAATEVFEVEPVSATLGETLAVWGIGDGFYLVVPFFGSSTLRDFTGTVIDALALTPYYSWWADDVESFIILYGSKEVNKVSLHLGEYEELKKISFDPYVALRNGYFQYREKIRDRNRYPDVLE